MANYCCSLRSNYFHVKSPDAFEAFMANVRGDEDEVHLWKEQPEGCEPVFGFGSYGGISGYFPRNEDGEIDDDIDCEEAYDDFLHGLQSHVADDDAVIILEAGNEKLRYIVGAATIITAKEIRGVDMTSEAKKIAADMLGISSFVTKTEY